VLRVDAEGVPKARTGAQRLSATLVAALAVALASPTAAAAPAPSGGAETGRSLAVSVPPEPTAVRPGETTRIPIRVLNPGHRPVTATITGREVRLLDNGVVRVGAGPDPAWQDRVRFTPSLTTLPAQGYADVTIDVDVPATLDPDLHFVGFLVSPVQTSQGQVKVINEIGSFVTLDVPGPRSNRLQARLQVPGFTLGQEAEGRLTVRNLGRSAVRFWGENDTAAWPGSDTPHQQRFAKSLVPIGRSRSTRVVAAPDWWVGFVTMQVRIVYPATTQAATREIAVRKRVLVVDPWALVVLGGVIATAVAAWVRHTRRRRRRLAARARRRGASRQSPNARRSAPKVGISQITAATVLNASGFQMVVDGRD